MFIDAANYSEHNTPVNKTVVGRRRPDRGDREGAQPEPRPSPYGRITTPHPLWDGTDRVLLAYRPARCATAR